MNHWSINKKHWPVVLNAKDKLNYRNASEKSVNNASTGLTLFEFLYVDSMGS